MSGNVFKQNNPNLEDDFDNIDSALSGGTSLKNGIVDKLKSLDRVEQFGAVMAGPVSIPVLGSPSEASEMNKWLSDTFPLGEHESEIHDFIEDVYDFKDEWLIGHETLADNPIQAATLSVDKLGHYSVGYLAGGLSAKGIDKFTDEYDPKKVALGGALALGSYAVAKEGLYEGGSGIQFDLDNLDVWGDWTMDTVGITHSIYNFHKRKTAENGEEPQGVLGEIANKAGRTYEKTKADAKSGREEFNYNKNGESSYLSDDTVNQESSILGNALDSVSNYKIDLNLEKIGESSLDEEFGGSKRSADYPGSISGTGLLDDNSPDYRSKFSSGLQELKSGLGSRLSSIISSDDEGIESMADAYN